MKILVGIGFAMVLVAIFFIGNFVFGQHRNGGMRSVSFVFGICLATIGIFGFQELIANGSEKLIQNLVLGPGMLLGSTVAFSGALFGNKKTLETVLNAISNGIL